jgi:arsenate reductase (thioredoxin)
MKRLVIIFISSFLLMTAGFIFWQFFMKTKTVLFLCVHNTFRSQIAEAYFNKFAKEKGIRWQAKSAGFLKSDKINEKAVILMREEGIDISDKKPKLMTEKMIKSADKIVVVCQECEAQGLCLVLPPDKDIEYWQLPNPAEMELEKAREIRNQIKEKVLNLISKVR